MPPAVVASRTKPPTARLPSGCWSWRRNWKSTPSRLRETRQKTEELIRRYLPDHARFAQSGDLDLAVAGLAQHLFAVLAQIWSAARPHLLLAGDRERAVDRRQVGIDKRDKAARREHLFVLTDIRGLGDDAEDQSGGVEPTAPLIEVSGGEDLIEDADQLTGMLLAQQCRRKSRFLQRRILQARLELVPTPLVRGDRQQEPAAVAAAIVDAQRVDRRLARRLRHHIVAAQGGLDRTAIGPEAVRQQRRADVIAPAGALALIERSDDRAIGTHGRGMIA